MFTARAKLWQYRRGQLQTESMVGREGRRTTHNTFVCIALIAAAALISGCGGGGGGSSGAPPALSATAFTITEDTPLTAQLTATDPENEALTFSRTSDPASGTVSSFDGASGSFVYQPTANFAGNDSFNVRVSDAAGNATDGTVTITVTGVNDDPIARNDVMFAEPAALSSLAVLDNDEEPDADTVTLSIEEQGAAVGTVGTAEVDSDTNTIRVTGLPTGFRGVTRFRYRVTDATGAFSVATAAVFIGTDPFRATFVGSEAADSAEVYMTDFVATWRLSAATEGNMRLRGFVASDNGATVVYRREDRTNAASTDLSFVRTADTGTQVRISLPEGQRLLTDDANTDPYAVSPDGQWIAVLAGAPNGQVGIYVLNVNDPGTLRNVAFAGALHASQPRFSNDSGSLFFLASDTANGAVRNALYRAATSGSASAELLSAPYVAGSADNISSYSLAANQTRVAVHAMRGGRAGVYFIDTLQPRTEVPMHHALDDNEEIVSSTVGLPAGRGGGGGLVAYTVRESLLLGIVRYTVYLARIEPVANNAQPLAGSSERGAIAFSPDDSALLVSITAGQTSEVLLTPGSSATDVGAGSFGLYDSTRNAVILVRPVGSGEALFSALREGGGFGTARQMGTPGLLARSYDLTGAPRGVAIIAEPASSGVPNTARFALVNAWAPDRRLELGSFDSPVGLTSAHARVVTY